MLLIGHGAQAKIYKCVSQKQTKIMKLRLPKKYRHPELDKKINESRIKSESKIIQKLYKKGLRVPKLLKTDLQNYSIEMQFIQGKKLKDQINDVSLSQQKIIIILQTVGKIINNLHQLGIIHGDLTTSNMIINQKKEIYLIDFGLSYFKDSAEDKAVDLYVLQRAFKSTHPQFQNLFQKLIISYNNQLVLKKLQSVRQRGRKKVAFG